MDTTTHSTSKGNVLPATGHDDHDDDIIEELDDDAPRTVLTFEQRTIRTLLSFERKRLAMQRMELAMEEARFAAHHEHLLTERINRAALFSTLETLATTHVPVVLPLLLDLLGVPKRAAVEKEREPIVPEWPGQRPKTESPRAAVG